MAYVEDWNNAPMGDDVVDIDVVAAATFAQDNANSHGLPAMVSLAGMVNKIWVPNTPQNGDIVFKIWVLGHLFDTNDMPNKVFPLRNAGAYQKPVTVHCAERAMWQEIKNQVTRMGRGLLIGQSKGPCTNCQRKYRELATHANVVIVKYTEGYDQAPPNGTYVFCSDKHVFLLT